MLRAGCAGGVAEDRLVGVGGAGLAVAVHGRVARDAVAPLGADGGGGRGVGVGPAGGAGAAVGGAEGHLPIFDDHICGGVGPVRTRLARAAGQAEVARAAEADQSARLGVGVRWTREARVAELVGPGGAQHARAAGGSAEAGVAHAGCHVRRRWWRSRVPSAGGARGAAGGGLVGARGAGRAGTINPSTHIRQRPCVSRLAGAGCGTDRR